VAHSPRRITQFSCLAAVVLGVLPWVLTLTAVTVYAIESSGPLPMMVVAWLVLLVPLWVAWFGAMAWRQRHETAVPAVVMATPPVLVAALFFMLPLGA
jgi:hypothetical protein